MTNELAMYSFKDSEFQILSGYVSDVQKTLNQWRHQYLLHIHSMTSFKCGEMTKVTILVTRRLSNV